MDLLLTTLIGRSYDLRFVKYVFIQREGTKETRSSNLVIF